MLLNESKPCRKIPIDKSWAWVILMASSIILIILQGNLRTFGLFFVELQRHFQTSSSAISIVLGTQWIANCLSSFLALNCLSTILSSRTMIIIGSILSALCFLLDSVASTALMLPFFHLLNGAGVAFIYGPCFVNIGHYFKKYRGTANALASCGASVGQFLFSPLVVFLISEYGINGALLLNSALFLQCTVFAMLLRPISFFEKHSSKETYLLAASLVELPTRNVDEISKEKSCKQQFDLKRETHEDVVTNKFEANSSSKHTEFINKFGQGEKKSLVSERKFDTEMNIKNATNKIGKVVVKDLYEKEEENNLHEKEEEGELHENKDYIIYSQMERNIDTSILSLTDVNKDFINKKQNSKWRKILSNVDFKLFKERIFLIYFFAAAIGQNASTLPQTYFPPYAEDIGFGRKGGAFFVAIAGFADLGGRILTTLIADRTFLNRTRFLGLVLFSHGIMGCFIPLYKTFWAFSAYCIYYGASGGILFALSPTVLTDFIGKRRLSQGLGLMYLFNGLLSSFYYPVLGYLRDLTKSYIAGFGLNSIALIISGVLFLSETCIKHKKASENDD